MLACISGCVWVCLCEGFSNHRCISPGYVPWNSFSGTITPSISPPITLSLISLSHSDSLSLYLSIHLSLFKSLLCHLSNPAFPLPSSLSPTACLCLPYPPPPSFLPPPSLSNLTRHLSWSWHGMIKRRPGIWDGAPLLTDSANNPEWLMSRGLSEQISDEATHTCEWSSLF